MALGIGDGKRAEKSHAASVELSTVVCIEQGLLGGCQSCSATDLLPHVRTTRPRWRSGCTASPPCSRRRRARSLQRPSSPGRAQLPWHGSAAEGSEDAGAGAFFGNFTPNAPKQLQHQPSITMYVRNTHFTLFMGIHTKLHLVSRPKGRMAGYSRAGIAWSLICWPAVGRRRTAVGARRGASLQAGRGAGMERGRAAEERRIAWPPEAQPKGDAQIIIICFPKPQPLAERPCSGECGHTAAEHTAGASGWRWRAAVDLGG
jgi:hypothetical protein